MRILSMVVIAITALLALSITTIRAQLPLAPHPQIDLRGFVFAAVSDPVEKRVTVALPHAFVTLADASNPTKLLATNISDLSGHFTLKLALPTTPPAATSPQVFVLDR